MQLSLETNHDYEMITQGTKLKGTKKICPNKMALNLIATLRNTAAKKGICFEIDCPKNLKIKTDDKILE